MGISDIDLREERAREDREDEKIEQKLRTDIDFFEDYFSGEIEELNKLKKEILNNSSLNEPCIIKSII